MLIMAAKQSLAERLKRDSHRICSLILNSDLPWIDIEIEINRMREVCATEAPEKLDLFEAVYVSRFTRLWEQWRETEHDLDDAAYKAWLKSEFFDDEDEDDGLATA
jgi:hypothetical protein